MHKTRPDPVLARCTKQDLTPSSQLSNVCGTQPIFGAIDATAAYSEGYSPRCSCTIRTARSRNSGENLLVLFMAPFSQELEPPRFPGRFRSIMTPNALVKPSREAASA